MGPDLHTKNPSSSEVHHLLPYHRPATYISSEKGAAGLNPMFSRAKQLLEVEVEIKKNIFTQEF